MHPRHVFKAPGFVETIDSATVFAGSESFAAVKQVLKEEIKFFNLSVDRVNRSSGCARIMIP